MDRWKRALFLVAAGLATLALTTWMSRHGRAVKQAEPDCAGCAISWDGMIRFEIATSRQEVSDVLGSADEPCGRCIRKVFDAQNHVDLGFMVAYSALNAAIALFLVPAALAGPGGRRAKTLLRIVLVAAGAMLLGDLLETLALLHLTGPDPAFGPALAVLIPATRIKWLALGLASLVLAGLYPLAHPRGLGRLLGLLALPYLVAGVAGLVAVATGNTEWYARHITWLAYAWLASLLHAALWLGWSLVRRLGANRAGPAGA
jgi:hypothetical protein